MLTLQQSLDLVYASFQRVGRYLQGNDAETRHPGVSAELFARLGLPRDPFPIVLVTGSKGKGSTALFTAAMLQGMGYRVGLVTSPHLVDFRERIRVDGQAIPVDDFVQVMSAHAEAINQLDADLPAGQYIGSNGIIFAGAIRYFLEQGVDAAVIEAGRGGRFDEASLFSATAVCLTPMMGEHLAKLGPTIADIAWHKAGLISPGSTVANANQPPEAAQVIAAIAADQGAQLLRLGAEIEQKGAPPFVEIAVPALNIETRFELRNSTPFQAENAALAMVAATAVARRQGRGTAGIERLVPHLRLPGRCEQISNQPPVIIDGAINRDSAAQFLAGALPQQSAPTVLITALPIDKDHEGLLRTLAPHVAHLIVTEATHPNLAFTNSVVERAQQIHPSVEAIIPSSEAFKRGLALTGEAGTLWVVGTQSLVREALRFWGQDLEQVLSFEF
jgi:dihydrofolate synthase / folylpolyglutamate synthase